jgi:hypothetical protein
LIAGLGQGYKSIFVAVCYSRASGGMRRQFQSSQQPLLRLCDPDYCAPIRSQPLQLCRTSPFQARPTWQAMHFRIIKVAQRAETCGACIDGLVVIRDDGALPSLHACG